MTIISQENSPARDLGSVSPVLDARNNLLSVLPRIIACMTSLWRAMKVVEKQEECPSLVMGAPKVGIFSLEKVFVNLLVEWPSPNAKCLGVLSANHSVPHCCRFNTLSLL